MHYQEAYLTHLREQAQKIQQVAKTARSKGLDPTKDVEIRPADDVAGRVEGLVGPEGVAERIRELSETEPAHTVALEIAREIIQGATVEGWDSEKAAEQAIRTALAILTEGITAGPIEGIASVKIKTNVDGSRYLAVYFAGPIRAAGGTEAAQTVIIADAIRQQLDLDRYKPSLENIERYVEEVDLYNRVSHLQYPSKPEEVRLAARSIPIEVTGEPTAEVEVTGYRDPPGVETNRLRGGAILVLNDSVLGKAHKLANLVEQLTLQGWEWLGNLAPRESDEAEVEQRIQPKEKYLEDIIAGRPILAYPSRKGGFRVRYGRSRNTGLAALGVHPATMLLLDNFIACGTQLIIERPGKGCIAMPVDSIHGPVVQLHDGSILRVDSIEEAKRIRHSIAKILFLGDLLVGFGEFRENNHLLVPAGYCPEWWAQETLNQLHLAPPKRRKQLIASIDWDSFSQILSQPLRLHPSPWDALKISNLLSVPLHPRYLYFWEDLSPSQLRLFHQWVQQLESEIEEERITALHGPLNEDIFPILETLCIPCSVTNDHVRFTEAAPILHALFLGKDKCNFSPAINDTEDVISYLQERWSVFLHPKGTFYIGARIGRPEKAKRRAMSPPPHGIFPVGNAGGSMRDIRKAGTQNQVSVEANLRFCSQCNTTLLLRKCPDCEQETEQLLWCAACNEQRHSNTCQACGSPTQTYGPIELPIKQYLEKTRKHLKRRLPAKIKGVKGLMSHDKVPEILEKAILRARHELFVYKDGTIRFDMTDAPLTHFKPQEIDAPIDQLQTLGYHFDINGAPLNDSTQILELKTQDIVIPYDCAKYLHRVSQFLDDLLVQVYDLEPFYQLKSPRDLIGHLVVGLAPHTSAGIIGRIIGFSPLRVCYAHPFWHAAKRRNCLHGSEELLIWDTKNDQLLKKPIGQVVESIIQRGFQRRVVDDFGTEEIMNPYSHWKVLSFNPETKHPISQSIKHWIKGRSNEWVKITTKSGRCIKTTPDHTIHVWDTTENTFSRLAARALNTDHCIPTLSNILVPQNNNISHFNILRELSTKLPCTTKFQQFKHITRLRNASKWMWTKLQQFGESILRSEERYIASQPSPRKIALTVNAYFRTKLPKEPLKKVLNYNWYRSIPLSHLEVLEQHGVFTWDEIPRNARIGMARDDKTLSPYIQFTNQFARLLGYFITEGYIRDERSCYQINFSVPNPTIRKHLHQLIKESLGSSPYYKKDNHQLCHASRIHAYLFAYAWKLGKNALNKRIPHFVFNAPEKYRLQFLSAVIDGDGSVIPRSCRTTIYTGNRKLAEDYCLLLSTLGVFARLSKTKGSRFGKKVLERYEQLGIAPKETTGLIHVNIPGRENIPILPNLTLKHKQKIIRVQEIIQNGFPETQRLSKISNSLIADKIKKVEFIRSEAPSYCLEVEPINSEIPAYHNIANNTLLCVGQCDGDEDSLLLALDPMINFSRAYLPATRGGTMDTPLVLSVTVTPKEIDAEAHNIDGTGLYPLEFYQQAMQFVDPKDVEDIFDLVAHRVVDHRIESTAESYGLQYSHDTSDINRGPRVTTYSKLKTMEEKVERQLALGARISAVDVQDMAQRLLDSHFFPDIFGNIRAFATQKFRCTTCNEKFRRIPLIGTCPKCSGKLVLTVTKAGITKYVNLATKIVQDFELPRYYQQRLDLARKVINSIFPPDEPSQDLTLKQFSE